MVTYLGSRNIAIFSCDLDSFDFKASKAQTARASEEAEGRRLQGGRDARQGAGGDHRPV